MPDHLRQAAQQVVSEQAEDEGLWFAAATASEAYLQQALRRLHAAVEQPPLPVQEPVGEVTEVSDNGFRCEFNRRLAVGTKLYTAPPLPAQPDELISMVNNLSVQSSTFVHIIENIDRRYDQMEADLRALSAKINNIKEKNT
jgi:hypothetical protein